MLYNKDWLAAVHVTVVIVTCSYHTVDRAHEYCVLKTVCKALLVYLQLSLCIVILGL